MDIINKLSSQDFNSQKLSVLNVISSIIGSVGATQKASLCALLKKYSADASPLIKKELGILLKDFSLCLDDDLIVDIISNILKEKSEFSKIPLFEAIVSLGNHKNISKLQDFIANSISALAGDECWRVRYSVAEKLHEVLKFASNPNLKALIVDIYTRFLDDTEAEVRKAVSMNLDKFCDNLGKDDLVEKVCKQFKKVEKDPVPYVRISFASTFLKIAFNVGKQRTVDYLVPLFVNFIKDDSHEIRIIALNTIDKLHEVVGIESLLQYIHPSFVEICNNKSWRTRLLLQETVLSLARAMVRIKNF